MSLAPSTSRAPSPAPSPAPLGLLVPLGTEEPAPSFCARLAWWNGRTMAAFCSDMKIMVRDLLDGSAAVLAKLATLGGIDAAQLMRSSIRSSSLAQVTIGAERLDRSQMRRRCTMLCPACLAEDMACRPDLEEAAPYGRVAWLVDAIGTCAIHERALVPPDAPECNDLDDFTLRLRPNLERLRELTASAPKRRPSSLETYVLARLAGRPALPPDWLAAQPLRVIIAASELVGQLAAGTAGKKLTEDERRSVDATGFDIVACGPVGIREILDTRVQLARRGSESLDAATIYGSLYEHLSETAGDSDYESLQRVVRDHLLETVPLSADEIVFGKLVGHRCLHSVATAATEFRAHRWLVRRLLAKARLLPSDHEDFTCDRVTFEAEPAAAILAKANDMMRVLMAAGARDVARLPHPEDGREELPLSIAAEYANMTCQQLLALCGADLVKASGTGPGMRCIRKIIKVSLYRFMKHLSEHAVRLDDLAAWELSDIPTAAKLAGCSLPKLIGLALDGSLTSLCCPVDFDGFLSLRVAPGEVRRLIAGGQSIGLTVHEVAQRLGVRDDVVRRLAMTGYLRSSEVSYPYTGIRQTIFDERDVAEFEASFVALAQLATARQVHIGTVRDQLTKQGLEPAFTPRFVGSAFYRRVDLSV